VVFEKWFMDFCYDTRIGQIITNAVLKGRGFSKLVASTKHKATAPAELREFAGKYGISLEEIRDPLESFATFNDFFIRKLKPGARSVDQNPKHLISPADARLFHYRIDEGTILPLKGKPFTVPRLIRNEDLSKRYEGGQCLVFRLAPADYHRFAYIDQGQHDGHEEVDGHLHSVSPYALRKGLPIFEENYRQYCVLETENFGRVVHLDVGAMAIGSIIQNQSSGGQFQRGDEKGYFEFGGSTIILLFEKDRMQIDDDIAHYSEQGIECLVKYGQKIGTSP